MGRVVLVSIGGQHLEHRVINEHYSGSGYAVLTGEEFVPEPSRSPICRPQPLEDW